MRTKKDIKFLLENGLSTSFVSKLNEVQTKSLVKRFNKKETNEITMVSSADSATQSKLQSEKKPYEVYEKTEMDEDSTPKAIQEQKNETAKKPWRTLLIVFIALVSVIGISFGILSLLWNS